MHDRAMVDRLQHGVLNWQREMRGRCERHDTHDAGSSTTRRAKRTSLSRRVDAAIHTPDGAETDDHEEQDPNDPPHARYSSTSAAGACHRGHAQQDTGGDPGRPPPSIGVHWQNGHGGQQPPLPATRDAAKAPVVTSAKTAVANAVSFAFIFRPPSERHRLVDRHGPLVHVAPGFKVKSLDPKVEFKVPY